MIRRFRSSTLLLLLAAIASAAGSTGLFMTGHWPHACLLLIACAVSTIIILHLQSKLIGIMSSFVKSLEMNDTTMRVEAGGDSELRKMSESMNRISELYHDNMRELQTRKLYYDRVLKIMTHEMRNGITPIAAISGDMQKHPERYQGKAFSEASALMLSQAEGIRRFLDAYYNLTHLPELRLERMRAGDYFQSVKNIYNSELESRGLPEETVSYTVPEDMFLTIDPSLMNQVMMNLLRNALDAAPPDGAQVKVILSVSDSRPYLTVSDNGSGIPGNVIDSLFTPFFTTKPQGSGVGLAISRQIILKHGGDIRLITTPSKGTTAIITLSE
ncbi:MAG: HAMP domain-containing histidine kinase [Muribaculaceae bacterium]|nr:HAMP domain-containing histidine kinase [Muribaculaceae bacterium]